MNADEKAAADAYCKSYKQFLDTCRTERLASREIIEQAEASGFRPLGSFDTVKPGDRIYLDQKKKSVILAVIGSDPLTSGMKIVASHIDSPRLDLKANPVHEQEGIVYFRTHYYGGIKKYQWTCIPLALIGVVFTKDGRKVDISVGLDPDDPVFCVTDLLIHMAQDQMKKTLAEGITGEQLQVIAGTASKEGQVPKEAILALLKEKYGIEEEDFTTAELELVPADQSRDAGLDRSLILSYGQDDRVCSYANLKAVLDAAPGTKTQIAILTDKEEIGSYGNTGMESSYFSAFITELLERSSRAKAGPAYFHRAMASAEVLSADVNSCLDPMFPDVSEKDNSALLGYGICLTKFTGARGKSGSNDANAEFLSKVRTIFNEAGVPWQIGELGKVDQGGGGTIAYMLANHGCEVVDCGTAMLSMHAPLDIVSKADAYATYLAYKAFFESK